MINILKEQPSVQEMKQVLEAAGQPFMLPPLGAAAWNLASHRPFVQQCMAYILERSQQEIQTPLPPLPDDLYAVFHQTGERIGFERIYFERRLMIARAAMCVLMFPDDPKWIQVLIARVWGMLEEKSWALPAHVTLPSGQDPMMIDLFAAETANLMGEIVTVFAAVLPETLIQRIKKRVHDQITVNALERSYIFWWPQNSNNWNAVCHQGVLGAAMALEDDQNLVARLLDFAIHHLPIFLAGFGADGASTEGPGYWQYGFGWFSFLNQQVEVRSGGRFSLFEGDEHVSAIARYGREMTLQNGCVAAFSDGFEQTILRPSLLCYLGDRLGDAGNRSLGLMNYQLLLDSGLESMLDEARCDFLFLSRLFLECPDEIATGEKLILQDCFLPDVQVQVTHTLDSAGRQWSLACKGGHNGEQHNHNDCGSFVVQYNGVMMVSEIGAPEYTRDFFGELRYQNLAARTLGHSLPIVNGFEQKEGKQHAAVLMEHVESDDEALFRVDIARCYPSEACCLSLVRTVRLNKRLGEVQVQDVVALESPGIAESAIITAGKVMVRPQGVFLERDGQSLKVVADPDTTHLQGVDEYVYRNHAGDEATVRRIVLTPLYPGKTMILGYRITPIARM